MIKEKRQKRTQVLGKKYEPMPIETFRKGWLERGYDLVDITKLCEIKIGDSGWCNDFNSPEETIYHLQVWYREEWIGSLLDIDNWEYGYVLFRDEGDFIIFKKCKVEGEGKLK